MKKPYAIIKNGHNIVWSTSCRTLVGQYDSYCESTSKAKESLHSELGAVSVHVHKTDTIVDVQERSSPYNVATVRLPWRLLVRCYKDFSKIVHENQLTFHTVQQDDNNGVRGFVSH